MKEKSFEIDTQVVTEDEAALYDRQIRLWGLPAQKRLRSSKVLVVGLRGLGAEICKNIVLAGIKSLTIVDHENVEAEDSCSQFFTNKLDIGSNRALCSQPKIQQLNPSVEVIVDTDNIKDKQKEFFLQFDIVCLTNCPIDTAVYIDNICREKKIKFIMGAVHGMFGYAFMDFGEHEYNAKPSATENVEGPPLKKCKTTDDIPLTKKIFYVSLQQALRVERPKTTTKRTRLTNSYFIMKALHEFYAKFGRNPKLANNDAEALNEILHSYLDDFDERLSRYCLGELSPACAIVGGVYGQEIINALSSNEITLNNFFFFNGLNGSGIVECIGN